MTKFASYILCTSPRSGSTLLCDLLARSGVAGHPESYFHRPEMASWARGVGLPETAPFADILRAAIGQGRGDAGVFGLRLQSHSRVVFLETLARETAAGACDLDLLQCAFGPTAFIYLNRDDKVAQAVSYLKATQSGLWHRAPDGSEIERTAPPEQPRYDAAFIAKNAAQFADDHAGWNNWFAEQGIEPLRLTYDALSADPIGELRRVLEHIGQNPDAANAVQIGVGKLADQQSRDWIARFKASHPAG
ncbi:hypothetical protein ACMU_09135 [Actibacterium mucosum KCTC 23349]|uniref:Sulphotransferase Stf0 domain-containing protein n=1 Tax=Actibacterium mucosum KCTC 23349 TaxID=1454373 RepID=A0A037ZMB3_9RHOB|nr:Stf0 family sulfotransferase [Actibacterium mucosum]KAJ55921.1 hypothetical protein ACMU_09135 [Actibacterium mucosum KCTC 23349]